MRNERRKLFYYAVDDAQGRAEKLLFLKTTAIEKLHFRVLHPDKAHNWLNLTDNDFEDLLPVCSKETKLDKEKSEEQTLFDLFSLGIVTARDAWVYDFDKNNLAKKVKFFISVYEKDRKAFSKLNAKKREVFGSDDTKISNHLGTEIKYTSELILNSFSKEIKSYFMIQKRQLNHSIARS